MVSTVPFYQVHQGLNEIFGCPTELPFAGLPFLVCGICISYHQLKMLSYTTVGVVDNEVEKLLLSRFVANDSPLYPKQVVHVFAENSPVVDYNDLMLNRIEWKDQL